MLFLFTTPVASWNCELTVGTGVARIKPEPCLATNLNQKPIHPIFSFWKQHNQSHTLYEFTVKNRNLVAPSTQSTSYSQIAVPLIFGGASIEGPVTKFSLSEEDKSSSAEIEWARRGKERRSKYQFLGKRISAIGSLEQFRLYC